MKKKFFKFFALYTIVSLLTINFAFVEVKTAKADPDAPIGIPINTCSELQSIGRAEGMPLDSDYYLADNIDCSATSIPEEEGGGDANLYNNGAGFLPIGSTLGSTTTTPFMRNFDGNNKTISNVTINDTRCNEVSECGGGGIFAVLGTSSSVYDLNLEFFDVSSSLSAGSLAGAVIKGNIENIHADSMFVRGMMVSGGLVGFIFYDSNLNFNNNICTDCNIFGLYSSGGLLGVSQGLNGLLDEGFLNINESYSSGSITSSEEFGNSIAAGGLVGQGLKVVISNSSSTMDVLGVQGSGGLVGLGVIIEIKNSMSTGKIESNIPISLKLNPQNRSFGTGGLIGLGGGVSITNSYSSGEISGINSIVGGLVGRLEPIQNQGIGTTSNTISNSYATGNIYSLGVGENEESCNEDTQFSNIEVGGLVGFASSTEITNSYFSGDEVLGSGDYIGGLVGYLDGSTIKSSYINNTNVEISVIDFCHPIGVGGLVGKAVNNSIISDTYFIGSDIYGNDYVGGLIGHLSNSSLNNSFAIVDYIQNESYDEDFGFYTGNIGGLVGSLTEDSVINSSFYKLPGTDIIDNGLGDVKTTIELKNAETFSGWNFENTWFMFGYPVLRFSYKDFDNKISTCEQLQLMNLDLDGDYELIDNIDCSGYEDFNPIGSENSPFTGSLNGKGWAINDLTISKSEENNVGLFASLSGASISNLNFVSSSITGVNYVGALSGYSTSTSISNVNVDMSSGGGLTGDTYIGGLVGSLINGSIASSSFFQGEIDGIDYVGGLVGQSLDSNITNSYADTNISGENYIGGLVGDFSSGSITSSYFSGGVSGTNFIGGLAGQSLDSNIIYSYADSWVEGSEHIGGLIGHATNSTIEQSFFSGVDKIKYANEEYVSGYNYVGGLIGGSYNSSISNSYSAANTIEGEEYVGGLVGKMLENSSINNSYSLASICNDYEYEYFGALVGFLDETSTTTNSYYDSNINNGFNLNEYGISKTTEELKSTSTFSTWDFDDIWDATFGNYMTLKAISSDDVLPAPKDVYVNGGWFSGNYPEEYDDLHVGEGLIFGVNAFNYIDDAIEAVAEGGNVYLIKNTESESEDDYDFNLNSRIYIEKSLNIIGEDLGDSGKVSIYIEYKSGGYFNIKSSNVSIKNLKIILEAGDEQKIIKVNEGLSSINISFNEMTILGNDRNGSAIITNSDVIINENIIKGFEKAIMIDQDLRALSNITISDNTITGNKQGIYVSAISNSANKLVGPNNEITGNDTGIVFYGSNMENLNNFKVVGNKIYNNFYIQEAYGDVGEVKIKQDLYLRINNSKQQIDISKNWWGSEFGPNVQHLYEKAVDCPVGPPRSMERGGGCYELVYSLISGSEENSDAAHVIINTQDSTTLNAKIIFRPFCTTADCSELSDNKIEVTTDGGLDSLFNFGTISIPSPTDEGDGSAITTSTQINVNEDVVIEIPTIANLSSTTISLSSTTISLSSTTVITKTDGGSFEFGNLSAQDMNKEGLSGFQEILSNFQSGDLIGALQWGIPNIGLSFSSPVTIEMYVGEELKGKILNIVRSTSTNTGWSQDGLLYISEDSSKNGTCLVSETGMCAFRTSKASYFSFLTTAFSGDDSGGDSSSNPSASYSPVNLPSGIGSGTNDISSTHIGETLNGGELNTQGTNFLTYITNQNHFSTGESSNAWRLANHRFVINFLNLNTDEAVITFYSDPKTLNIKKGESKEVDLDGDKINDVKVTFSNIYVNRAEITVKSLSNISTETPETITTETIKITNDSLYNRLKGKILLKVEDNGRAYYVSPTKKEMYYLGRPSDAFSIMRQQGIGVTDTDLNKILTFGNKIDKNINTSFSKKHNGKIFLQVQQKGEAWYVDTTNNSKHYLGRPNDAFSIMRNLGLGISNLNFSAISK